MRTLEALYQAELTRKLGETGWAHVPGGKDVTKFAMHEAPDVVFQLGIDMSVTDRDIETVVTLAVHHPEVSRLSDDFMGRRPGPGGGTVGFSLEDLVYEDGHRWPTMTRWCVRSTDDVQPVVSQLCQDINSYGLRVLRSMPTLQDIVSRLTHEPRSQVKSGTLAIAAAVAGQLPEALSALAEYAAEAQTQVPPMSTQSWRFIRSFVEHFGIDESSLPYKIPT